MKKFIENLSQSSLTGVPLISIGLCLGFLCTKEDIYLFLSGSILLIFSLACFLILVFFTKNFGLIMEVEAEIHNGQWMLVFLSVSIFITSVYFKLYIF